MAPWPDRPSSCRPTCTASSSPWTTSTTSASPAIACAPQTSAILAAALQQLSFDIVLCGAESTDGQLSVMPALLAERLGIPQL